MWVRRSFLLAAGVIAAGLVAVALLHTSATRSAVLARAAAYAEARYGIRIEASRLEYNLVRLSFRLSGVRVASPRSPSQPFFEADRLEIDLPPSVLGGALTITRLSADRARVHVLRAADGTSNLPSSTGGTGEPTPIPIGRMQVSDLTVEVADEPTAFAIVLAGGALDVTPRSGRITALRGQLRWRDTASPISLFEGGLRFDGRTARIDALRVITSDAAVETSGTIDVLARQPRMQLAVSGTGELPRLARWATETTVPTGSLTIAGTVAGPLASPRASMRLRTDTLSWQGLEATQVESDLLVDAERLQVTRLDSTLVEGRVQLRGEAWFATGQTTLAASWQRLDAGALARVLAPNLRPRLAARTTGSADLRGQGSDVRGWTLGVRSVMNAGATSRGQLGLGGTLEVQMAEGDWRLAAALSAGSLPVSARVGGRVNATTPAASTVTGTLTSTDADLAAFVGTLAQLDVVAAPDDPIAGVATTAVRVSGTLAAPSFEAAANVTGLRAAGLTGFTLDATARGTVEEMDIAVALRQGTGNALALRGTVRPTEAGIDSRIEGRLVDLPALGLARFGGVADVELRAAGPFQELGVGGEVRVAGAQYDTFALGDIQATVSLDPEFLRADARLDRFNGRLRWDLQRLSRRARIDLAVSDADIARLVPADTPATISGAISLTATAEVPVDRWEDGVATVEVSRLSGSMANLAFGLTGPAQLNYAGGVVDVRTLGAQIGELRASFAGRIPARSASPAVPDTDALHADVIGDVAGVIDTVRALGLLDAVVVSGTGPVALRARIGGSLERVVALANIETGPGTVRIGDLPAVTLLQVRATLDGARLVVTEATGQWQGTRVFAGASLPLGLLAPYVPARVASALPEATESATVTLRTDAITPRVLEPFVAPDVVLQLGGSVVLSAALQSDSLDLRSVRGQMQLDRVDLSVAGFPVTQSEVTRVVVDGGVARVTAWEWQGPASVVRVGGQVGLADRTAAILLGGRFDLRLLAPWLSGTGLATTGSLEPRISVVGPLEGPIVEGELVLTDAELRLESPQVIATDLQGFAVLTPAGISLTRLSGRVNGGTITASGSLDYTARGPSPAGLQASIAGMALDFPAGLRSEVDAELSLAITRMDSASEPRARLSGVVSVARGAYREPISVVTELLSALRQENLALQGRSEESVLGRLDLDVRVVTDDDVIVRNNLAEIQLGADLRLIGTAAVPALSGRATVREGGTLALGNNRYIIDQGTIDFSNPAAIEPVLNIQAHTRAGGEDIELTLTGTPATLDVALASTSDPLLGEADIASLLLTGRRLEEVPGAEARIVGEQVLGYLSGDVLGVASRAIGFDTVRLGGVDDDISRGASTIATQIDPTSRITFVKSFGDEFEVTLSQGLRNAAQTWVVDYLPGRRVVLRLVSRDDSLRSYELRHDVSVGAAATVSRPQRPPAASRPVRDVTLEGDLAVPESDLRRALRLSPGDAFDSAAWQADRDRLEAALRRAGRLEARVASSMAERDGGVALTYRIASGPRTALRVVGHPLPESAEDAIREAWAASLADEVLQNEVRTLAGRALAVQGFMRADVAVSIDALTRDGVVEKTLVVTINPGERTGQRTVRLEPPGLAVAEDIRQSIGAERLAELAEAGPSTLARALTEALRERGYVQGTATVRGPAFDAAAATWIATLTPGPMFAVGSVTLEGGGAARDAVLRELEEQGFFTGASFTPASLDTARSVVLDAYRRRGFPRSAVTPRLDVQPSGRADVTFAVVEGRQQVLRRVVIEGNRAVRADEITRALDLDIGEPLASDAWLEARTRVFQTGLFSRVDVSTEEIADEPASETAPVAFRVVVQEWPALRLRYGFQLSEEWQDLDPLKGRNVTPGISADATRRSLFGRAVTLGAAAIYRNRERLTRMFASTPTLWGRRIESLISAQQIHTELPGETLLHRDVAGVSWEQRTRVASHLEFSYSYRFERNHTFDPNPPENPLFPVLDITANVARLVGTAAFDSRNDPLDTGRGAFASSSLEYAPEALGSTSGIKFVKSLTQFYYFRPWRGAVLASAARLGVAKGLGGVNLIPTERFRAGGARSVRGVEEESLGPRDEVFGDVLGGNALLLFNQELRFPVHRWLRGAAFTDLGNVFARPRDVALGDLVGSSGLGLRLVTPFGLLRVDYGRLWSPREGQSGGRWSFGIGQAF